MFHELRLAPYLHVCGRADHIYGLRWMPSVFSARSARRSIIGAIRHDGPQPW